MPPGSRVLIVFGVLTVLSSGAEARADAEKDAESLIRRAVELRRSQDDAAALPLLQHAYELRPTDARTAVQLGLVEYALGRWAEAEDHLLFGLRQPSVAWVAEHRPTIVQSLQVVRRHVGSVEISGDPAGSQVFVNGRYVGRLPLDHVVRVNAGTADVEFRAVGYRQALRTVRVVAGSVQSLVMHQDPDSLPGAAASSVSLPVPPASSPVPEPNAQVLPGAPGTSGAAGIDVPLAPTEGRSPLRSWAIGEIALAAGAVASAGLAGYGYFRHEHLVDQFGQRRDSMNRPRCLESGDTVVDATGLPGMSDCFSLRSSYRSARATMIAGVVAASALAAAAVTLWIVDPERDRPASRVAAASWACAPAPHGKGVECMLVF